jgi:hypothetical protein
MCICYLELNQLKNFINMSKNNGDCFLLFNILDHLLVFANLLEKSFQNLLQLVKGIRIRHQEAFSRFEIFPLFQMVFL